jgi:putative FmdB family regulatory protein
MMALCGKEGVLMPVYNFVCPTCGARFEERLSFSESTSAVICPNGHSNVQRVFTAPTIVFKGSGFYVTDHRKPAQKHAGPD